DPLGDLPTAIDVQLTWDGTPQAWVTFSTVGHRPGDHFLLNTQVIDPVSESGMYSWEIEVRAHFADGSIIEGSDEGLAQVVVQDASPFGPGWGLDGWSRLVLGEQWVLRVFGSGESTYFERK